MVQGMVDDFSTISDALYTVPSGFIFKHHVISFIKNNYFIFKIIKNYPYLHDV